MQRTLALLAVLSVAPVAHAAPEQPSPAPPPTITTATAGAPTHAQLAELSRVRGDSLRTRRGLSAAVVAAGVVSAVAGVILVIPDGQDQAIRTAGVNTLAFGVVNGIVGGVALAGIADEEQTWEVDGARERETPAGYRKHLLHALADERREAVSHGINLGLAGAYTAAGVTAITASQLGVDHPDRWLAGGIAITTQAAFLVVIDAIGLLSADSQYDRVQQLAAPTFGVELEASRDGQLLPAFALGTTGRF